MISTVYLMNFEDYFVTLQVQLHFTVPTLVEALAPSSWITCSAIAGRQDLLTVFTMELATITVSTVKMQDFVAEVCTASIARNVLL